MTATEILAEVQAKLAIVTLEEADVAAAEADLEASRDKKIIRVGTTPRDVGKLKNDGTVEMYGNEIHGLLDASEVTELGQKLLALYPAV